MDNEKLLTSKEYNTIAVNLLSDCMYQYHKKEIDLILDKLFIITIKDLDTVAWYPSLSTTHASSTILGHADISSLFAFHLEGKPAVSVSKMSFFTKFKYNWY